jgi:hypothetical protein
LTGAWQNPFVSCADNTGVPSLGLVSDIPNFSECLHGAAQNCITLYVNNTIRS